MLSYADLLLDKNFVRILLRHTDREALHFLLNVVQNSLHLKYSSKTRSVLEKFRKEFSQLIDKRVPTAKKKHIFRRKGHIFIPLLIKPHLKAFRKLL